VKGLSHELVNVVVVTVLDAGADTTGPRGPQAVADPALAEGGHPGGRAVRRIAGVEGVGEIVVLDLDRVPSGGYPRENVPVAADGGEGSVVLDAAQHVRYTGGVHKLLLMGRASGCW
jgi:hypothetical protein